MENLIVSRLIGDVLVIQAYVAGHRASDKKRLADFSRTRSYDLVPDGNRIVALMHADGPEGRKSPDQLSFPLNLFDELRRRMPSGGSRVNR